MVSHILTILGYNFFMVVCVSNTNILFWYELFLLIIIILIYLFFSTNWGMDLRDGWRYLHNSNGFWIRQLGGKTSLSFPPQNSFTFPAIPGSMENWGILMFQTFVLLWCVKCQNFIASFNYYITIIIFFIYL